jgi:hypothetical protein
MTTCKTTCFFLNLLILLCLLPLSPHTDGVFALFVYFFQPLTALSLSWTRAFRNKKFTIHASASNRCSYRPFRAPVPSNGPVVLDVPVPASVFACIRRSRFKKICKKRYVFGRVVLRVSAKHHSRNETLYSHTSGRHISDRCCHFLLRYTDVSGDFAFQNEQRCPDIEKAGN